MLEKFLKYIKDKELFQPNDKILLAISGGRDSMAMVKLFELAEFQFGIAHFNHKTRNGESDLDQEFIELFAKEKNIDFYSTSVNIEELIEKSKENNFHDLARKKRYEWLEFIRKSKNYTFIATAHHLDDNIETFLYKIIKGSGIKGLTGINPKIKTIIRPLLNISRSEIDEFVKNNDLEYREDSSNISDKYDRNFIRHNIIPKFKKLNSNFNKRINVTINNLKKTNEVFDFLIDSYSDKFIIEKNKQVHIDKDILNNVPNEANFLFFLLSNYGFNQSEIFDILSSFGKTGHIFTNSKFELLIERKELIIRKKEKNILNEYKVYLGRNVIEGFGTFLVDKIENTNAIDYDSGIKYLNGDIIKFPLVLRQWQNGDRFHPFGLKGKSKKIKDYFVDKKLSRFEKENTMLLLNNGEICLVPGFDISYKYKVTKECKNILSIKFLV